MSADENSVANAKLVDNTNLCKLSNLQYWEDVTHMYNVDQDGEPIYETEHTDGDFRCYWCTSCDMEFATYEEAKEHLNE